MYDNVLENSKNNISVDSQIINEETFSTQKIKVNPVTYKEKYKRKTTNDIHKSQTHTRSHTTHK